MRLFVALDLPEAVRAALPVPAEPWRPVGRAELHVTITFLGAQPAAEPVVAAMPDELPPAGVLQTGRTRRLPARRPRVLAVELEDPSGACAALQAVVASALTAAGVHTPERHRWLPHVTIGRARGRVPLDTPLPAVERLEFIPETVTLYESHMNSAPRTPARYEPVARWALTRS